MALGDESGHDVEGRLALPAVNTVLENGASVVLLDKSSFCGGNSTKATSGIDGANTRTQRERRIEDSADLFTSGTLKGENTSCLDEKCERSYPVTVFLRMGPLHRMGPVGKPNAPMLTKHPACARGMTSRCVASSAAEKAACVRWTEVGLEYEASDRHLALLEGE